MKIHKYALAAALAALATVGGCGSAQQVAPEPRMSSGPSTSTIPMVTTTVTVTVSPTPDEVASPAADDTTDAGQPQATAGDLEDAESAPTTDARHATPQGGGDVDAAATDGTVTARQSAKPEVQQAAAGVHGATDTTDDTPALNETEGVELPGAAEADETTDASEPADVFDKEYATEIARRIVRDIATGDERFSDRPELGAATTMDFLSSDMENLLSCGTPASAPATEYRALVTTLRDFYAKAATQLPDDITGAASTYTVARKHTAELLTMLNPPLGTKHSLPRWSFM